MIIDCVFNSIMWFLVKLRICERFVITSGVGEFKAYKRKKKGQWPR